MNLNSKFIITASFFSWLFCNPTSAQQVSLFAGVAYPGRGEFTTVRNNPKLEDYYSNPYGIAIDVSGRVYFTDEHNLMLINGNSSLNRVGTPLDPSLNGGYQDGTATEGLFNTPQGVAVHPITQDVYVCDFFNHSIRKIEKFLNLSSSQTMTTHTGAGPSSLGHVDGNLSQARFQNPSGIVIAQNGDMYISDRGNHVIRKISGNVVSTIAGSPNQSGTSDGVSIQARFNLPEGLAIDGDTMLFIADFGNRRIRTLNLNTGEVKTLIATSLYNPRAVTIAGEALFITDLYRIMVYHNGQLSVYAGGETPDDIPGFGNQARFGELMGITFHPMDSILLVVDEGYNVLKSVTIDRKYFPSSEPNLGLALTQKSLFSISPNPAHSVLYVRSLNRDVELKQIEIKNLNGAKVEIWETKNASYENAFDLSFLSPGMYFLQLICKDGDMQMVRFIKE